MFDRNLMSLQGFLAQKPIRFRKGVTHGSSTGFRVEMRVMFDTTRAALGMLSVNLSHSGGVR